MQINRRQDLWAEFYLPGNAWHRCWGYKDEDDDETLSTYSHLGNPSLCAKQSWENSGSR